jgi:hypothetical protein
MPIAVRHLESMIRMAEARAAMHLREYVTDADIDCAIRIMLDSFVSSQKLSVQKALRRKFRRYLAAAADFNGLVLLKLQECLRDARRVEAITGQQDDPTHYVVPVRCVERGDGHGGHRFVGFGLRGLVGCSPAVPPCCAAMHRCALPAACGMVCTSWGGAAALLPPPRASSLISRAGSRRGPSSLTPTHRVTDAPPPCTPALAWPRRQLEERCRDLEIFDLQPFFGSDAFTEAGFRLAPGGHSVLLGRA